VSLLQINLFKKWKNPQKKKKKRTSGDPAAACCSCISELQNPDCNQNAMSGKGTRVLFRSGKVAKLS